MDFKEICRVCTAKTSGMKSIYESYNFWVHHREIFKVITDCASVQIEKFDGFSEQICPSCLEHLSQAYSFKKICEDSDYKFRNDLIVSDKIEEKYELHDNKIKTENDCDYDQYGLEEVDCIDLSDSPKHQEHSDLIDPQCIENDSNQTSCTPPQPREIANSAIDNVIPNKSRSKYEKEYKNFCTWCDENKVASVTENVVLAYFNVMSRTKKASTMWSNYSMLRTCLSLYKDIDISTYTKLSALLKRKSQNYQSKKSKILESEEVIKFINEANDDTFLAMKVILIMGFCGACRRDELTNMSVHDINLKPDIITVTVPRNITNESRLFCITELSWINLINKYVKLRPSNTTHSRFFVTYRNGKCVTSPIGINKIGQVPRSIAKFLKLSHPEQYTGNCFRRSSATQLANQGGDLLTIKKHRGWKSSAVAEGYVDGFLKKKVEVAQMPCNQPKASTSSAPSPLRYLQTSQNQESVESSGHVDNTNEDGTVIQNQNIVLTEQSLPGISVSVKDTVTLKIYGNCTIKDE